MSALTVEGDRMRHEIQERGYYELNHGIPYELIEGLVEAYGEFTAQLPEPDFSTLVDMLPITHPEIADNLDVLDRSADRQTDWHKYRTNAEGVAKPNGYTNRHLQQLALASAGIVIPPEDPKEYYHYSPQHRAGMRQNHAKYNWGDLPREVTRLDDAFEPIHERAVNISRIIFSMIEETNPEALRKVSARSLIRSPLRLLFYRTADGPEQCLGGGHYDKSAITIQIAESHGGLRIARSKTDELQHVQRDSKSAVAFVGRDPQFKLQDMKPGWHDIQPGGAQVDGRVIPEFVQETYARWALIFFPNTDGFVQPGKLHTHIR